jgi:hypothetical protein
MPNFIDNNVSLPVNKTNITPLPAGANAANYVAANDYNSLSQASQDIRTVIERQVSIMSFGADPTGTNDNSAAFAAAIAAMTDGGILHIPGINSGTTAVYKISANVIIPKNITLSFDNALISIGNGYTLTCYGAISAPALQIFEFAPTPSATPVTLIGPTVVYPQWFGAIGNGVVDCTAAITYAMLASQSGGTSGGTPDGSESTARIFFPNGNYVISSSIDFAATVGNFTHIVGDDAIIKAFSSSVSPFIGVNYNTHIEGLNFVGGATAISIATADEDSSTIKIVDCEFHEQTVAAIFVDTNSASTLLTISRCKFENNESGNTGAYLLNAGSGYITIEDCWCEGYWGTFFNLGSVGVVLRLIRMLGVPENGTGQWINVTAPAGQAYAGVYCDGCRFGGEAAKTLLTWSCPPSLSSTGTQIPTYMYFSNCEIYGNDSTHLMQFYTLPNAINFINNTGNFGTVGIYFDSGIPDYVRSQLQAQFVGNLDIFGVGFSWSDSDPAAIDNILSPLPAFVSTAPGNADQLITLLVNTASSSTALHVTLTSGTNTFGNYLGIGTCTLTNGNWNIQWTSSLSTLAAGAYTISYEIWCTAPLAAYWNVAGKTQTIPLITGKQILSLPFYIGANEASPIEWTTSTTYNVGDYILSTDDTTVYVCTASVAPHQSASAGNGPVGLSGGSGTSVSDNNITWEFVSNKNVGLAFYGLSDGNVVSVGPVRVFNSHQNIETANTVAYGTAAPTTGNWLLGDLVYNSQATSSSNIGWVCTLAGNPGAWTSWPSGVASSVNLSSISVDTINPHTPSGPLYLNGQILEQSASSTSLTLKGNAPAVSSVGVILDNITTQTSGKVLSIRSGGTELLYVDVFGDFYAAGTSATVFPLYYGTSGNSAFIKGQLAGNSGAAAVVASNVTTQTNGLIFECENTGGTNMFGIAFTGHILPGTAGTPVIGSFAGNGSTTGWGNTSSPTPVITGGDSSFTAAFDAGGTTASISAGTALFTITLNNAYSSIEFTAICKAQIAAAAAGESYYCIPGGSGANFTVYSTQTFTPTPSTEYKFQFITMGAGATY